MDPTRPGRPRPRPRAVGRAGATYERSATGSTCSRPCPGCRTWSSPPTAGTSSAAGCSAPVHHPQRAAEAAHLPGAGYEQPTTWAGPASSSRGTSTRPRATSPSSATSCWRATASAPTPRAHAEAGRGARASGAQRCAWSTRATTTSTRASRRSTTRTSPTPARLQRGRRALLELLYPDAVLASRADARGARPQPRLGRAARRAAQDAPGLAAQLADAGYVPVPVDLSELAIRLSSRSHWPWPVLLRRARGIPHTAERTAFPLGGVGTGNVSIVRVANCATGSSNNHPDKGRFNPYSFAIHARPQGGKPVTRVLEAQLTGRQELGCRIPVRAPGRSATASVGDALRRISRRRRRVRG